MRVLYLEDARSDAELTLRELRDFAPDIRLEIVGTVAGALARLDDFQNALGRGEDPGCDLVLLDLNLPDGSGLGVLAELRHRALPLAAVVLTGSGDEQTVLAALRAGADDYVVKRHDYWTALAATLRAALARFRSRAARHERPLRLLYAEPHTHDVALTRMHLAAHAPYIRMEVVQTADEVLARLPGSGPVADIDAILLDYLLPGMNAIEALKEILEVRGLDVPVILTTGYGSEDLAIEALKLGAADYIVKSPGYLNRLPTAVENAFHRVLAARERAALRESEEQYRRIVELSPDAITIHHDGRWVFANTAAARILGVQRPEHLLGQSPLNFMHPESHELARARWTTLHEENSPADAAELKMLRPDGSIVYLETRAVPIAWKGRPATQVFGRDVTERKLTDEALRSYAERLQAVSRRLVQVEETERRAINQELHDRIGQNLSALGLNLNLLRASLSKDAPGDAAGRLESALKLLETTTGEVRNVMAELHPPALDDYGLLAALRNYAESFGETAGLPMAVTGEEPEPRLRPAVELALFRIAQGAITNSARHAHGTRIGVELSADPGKVMLTVSDDGRGFDVNGAGSSHPSWGLTIMRERAEAIGACLHIESRPGHGTRVIVEAPREHA